MKCNKWHPSDPCTANIPNPKNLIALRQQDHVVYESAVTRGAILGRSGKLFRKPLDNPGVGW
jgi:hypothetical protein